MNIKRILSLMLFAVLLVSTVPNITIAQSITDFEERVDIISIEDISKEEMEERENKRININLSEENNLQPKGTRPPTRIWDLKTEGRYSFSGYAERSVLYSDYILKSGGGGFGISVNNYHSEDLHLRVNDRSLFGQTLKEITIPGRSKASLNVYTDKNIELQFSAPSDTSGSVGSLN